MTTAKPEPPKPQIGETPIRVIGDVKAPFRDLYHRFLRLDWWASLAAISGIFLVLNVLFAFAFAATDGIAGARPGNLWDAFCFSVQTMGTIGYGSMYPTSVVANVLVVAEAVVGLIVTALATGLVFAKFSLPNARIEFSRHVVISPMDGVPTLSFRAGNRRANQIVEAYLKVVLMRTEHTSEGHVFYRMYDLPLTRERSPVFSRSFNGLHKIDERSLLFGYTPEKMKADEVELVVTLIGVDEHSMQPVHARHTYVDGDILWGSRLADVLSEQGDGSLILDLRRFHDVVPAVATPTFPYPVAPAKPLTTEAKSADARGS